MLAADALPQTVEVIDAEILASIAFEAIPARAWTPLAKNIYPIKVPRIRFSGTADLLLVDCPARNLALMPNGLGYVHNALKKAGINFETFDLDIVTYHRYHIRRLFDEAGKIVMASGREMPTDPWQAENYDLWENPEVLAILPRSSTRLLPPSSRRNRRSLAFLFSSATPHSRVLLVDR